MNTSVTISISLYSNLLMNMPKEKTSSSPFNNKDTSPMPEERYLVPKSFLFRLLTLNFSDCLEITNKEIWDRKSGTSCFSYSRTKQIPKIQKGTLWDTILLTDLSRKTITIKGISKRHSSNTLKILSKSLGNFHVAALQDILKNLASFSDQFYALLDAGYARYSAVENWGKEFEHIQNHLDNEIALAHIPPAQQEIVKNFQRILINKHAIREEHNNTFISQELATYQNYFNEVESNPLTHSQRIACVTNEDNALVLAGAGSGKTSVIIAKTGYLMQSGLATADEILILAYGRKASAETNERISEKLPQYSGVTTSTFHKLGLSIIGKATGKKPSISKLQEDRAEFYRQLNDFISDLIQEDKSYNQRLIDYFVTYLRRYKSQFDCKTSGDYYDELKEERVESLKAKLQWHERNKTKTSLARETLKSFEEVVIADYLFVNGVEYIYEDNYQIDTATATHAQYRPDFYLPKYDIYIEHFGINRKQEVAPFMDQASYLEGMRWKRALHQKHSTKLIETFSYEMQEGTLTDLLQEKLEKHGVQLNPLSYYELLELLQKIGDETSATKLTKTITTFLDLFKQSGQDFETVRYKASQHPEHTRCQAFLDIFEPIFQKYTQVLEQSNTLDFSDMIRKATALVQQGKYRSPFKYILVDEFQDISAIRADLVKALIQNGTNTALTCVGDDWQSIYRFSGSDIWYTSRFKDHFGYTKEVALDRTFRFNDKINAFATTFITQNPAQLKKNVTSHTTVSHNAVTLVEYHQDIDEAIENCVRQLNWEKSTKAIVYILGRYSFSKPSFFLNFASHYPQYEFVFDTVHSSKGKEADFVIVVDVNDGKYGFPSKVDDEPLYELVLPAMEPHEYAEERRLFYVAVTRAKQHTFILYDTTKPSVFIEEIKENTCYKYDTFSTEGAENAPPEYGLCSKCGTGKLAKRTMPDGRFFFGCNHYPFCNNTPPVCPACNRYPLVKGSYSYNCQNPHCDYSARMCKQCGGVMMPRTGRYGAFFGCSNYSKNNCRYTEKS